VSSRHRSSFSHFLRLEELPKRRSTFGALAMADLTAENGRRIPRTSRNIGPISDTCGRFERDREATGGC
jgi:hypothetical protein